VIAQLPDFLHQSRALPDVLGFPRRFACIVLDRPVSFAALDTVECVKRYWSLASVISQQTIDRAERGRSCGSKGSLGSTTTTRCGRMVARAIARQSAGKFGRPSRILCLYSPLDPWVEKSRRRGEIEPQSRIGTTALRSWRAWPLSTAPAGLGQSAIDTHLSRGIRVGRVNR
jgi:hypothetical protein